MYKPILFSTPMVQAILEGRKTMTRRMLPEWCSEFGSAEIVLNPELCDKKALEYNEIKPKQYYGTFACFDNGEEHLKCKYEVGDILWVRETWRPIEQDFGKPRYEYRATKKINITDKWKPSIFMPKEACRIFLKVKSIRVERLHDISESDAISEGIEPIKMFTSTRQTYKNYEDVGYNELLPIHSFQSLWQSINENWDENPFVWVIEFENERI